jgi:dipeptidyl aminopeptidase/acylaminoacyl peptidase
MRLFQSLLLTLLLSSGSTVFAQMPDTDIWLFDITKNGDSISFSNALNITNRPGYDNQPAFSPDGKRIIYSSYRDGQSDIYSYDIASHNTTAFCKTPESEYSPAFTPDGKYISVVRVGKDSAQRLAKFPLKGGEAMPVFNPRYKMDSIAYYCWKDSTNLLVLLVATPEKLIYTNVHTIDPLIVAINSVGRTMVTDDAGINYIVSRTDSVWSLCKLMYLPTGISIQFQVKCLKNVEDFAIYKDEVFICGKGSWLYSYDYSRPYKESEYEVQWTKQMNLAKFGLTNISRLTISHDGKRIAVVNTK